ncbi:TIGR01548 family HAD-type hydrolase [Salisaeta longa]|uniref:TIGR01548 family HAD-type hydrolase n=1 Tax=Salisaeta longa TaxID=503170 RepID=UPI0003B487D4|nr:TIGR01548 family HAD-type hydrolase [Salisaeta longa]
MPQSVSLSVILFDMDGVLVDVSRSYRRAIQETVEHFTGRQISANAVQRYKNEGGFNDDWKLTHAVITDTAMEIPLSRVIEEFQRRYRGDNWDGFIAEEEPLIDADTLDALAARADIMGIVTGRPQDEAEWTIEHFGWTQYFPLVIGKEKQGDRPKPDPYPLNHCRTLLAAAGRPVDPDETVYIGDSVDDMKAARAANMWAVGMVPPYLEAASHGPLLRERGAHLIIEDAATLPDLVDNFTTRVALQTN